MNGERFAVIIETTGETPPSERQIQFYESIVGDADAAFARAATLLAPEYENWTRRTFPEQWRDAFKFVGMSVPLEGLDTNPWDLSFGCITDKEGHMFTCYFEAGRPSRVTVDG